MGWAEYGFRFTATGGSTTLTFASTRDAPGAPNGKSYGAALDNVRVNPVPIPGTVVLLASGIAGVAGWGRRRRKR